MECTCSAMQCTLQIHCSTRSVPAVFLQCTCGAHCSYTENILPVHSTSVWDILLADMAVSGKPGKHKLTCPKGAHSYRLFRKGLLRAGAKRRFEHCPFVRRLVRPFVSCLTATAYRIVMIPPVVHTRSTVQSEKV